MNLHFDFHFNFFLHFWLALLTSFFQFLFLFLFLSKKLKLQMLLWKFEILKLDTSNENLILNRDHFQSFLIFFPTSSFWTCSTLIIWIQDKASQLHKSKFLESIIDNFEIGKAVWKTWRKFSSFQFAIVSFSEKREYLRNATSDLFEILTMNRAEKSGCLVFDVSWMNLWYLAVQNLKRLEINGFISEKQEFLKNATFDLFEILIMNWDEKSGYFLFYTFLINSTCKHDFSTIQIFTVAKNEQKKLKPDFLEPTMPKVWNSIRVNIFGWLAQEKIFRALSQLFHGEIVVKIFNL